MSIAEIAFPSDDEGGAQPPTSPFDGKRRVTKAGKEWWTARDLMEPLGYSKWDMFREAISRASLAIAAQGIDAGQHIRSGQSEHKAKAGFGERTYTLEDFALTRYGAYHVALMGDGRKPEVAAAIQYFVVKTREAEVSKPLTGQELISAALVEATRILEMRDLELAEAEAKVTELKPRALSASVAENNHGGQLVWELREAIAARTGTPPREVLKTLAGLGAIRREGKPWVHPSWDDLLFPTDVMVETASRGTVAYPIGPYRVRDGKQDELVERVAEAYVGNVVRLRPKGIETCILARDLAHEVGLGQNTLLSYMRDWGMIRDPGTNARSFATDNGYMLNDKWPNPRTGEINVTGKITPKGRQYIIGRLRDIGILG
ncbi:phage antirepressor protein [Mycolicibacterium rhodesiae JS60]|nr:phage antirepressor protein [Mycolicibacterium rhodesiae JS60]